MTNGQKVKTQRERNQAKIPPKKGEASNLKADAAALTIVCQQCRATFMCTAREAALTEHATNKHSKSLAECFPSFQSS